MTTAAEQILAAARDRPPALLRLAETLMLDDGEVTVLSMALAYEKDAQFARSISELNGEKAALGIPVWLFHQALGQDRWDIFAPAATLRQWRILLPQTNSPAVHTCYRLAETVFAAMTGCYGIDPLLEAILQPASGLAKENPADAQHISQALDVAGSDTLSPVVVVPWRNGVARAASALGALGLHPYLVNAGRLAARIDTINELQRLIVRDCALRPLALVATLPSDVALQETLSALCNGLPTHVLIVGEKAPTGLERSVTRLDQETIPRSHAIQIWHQALGSAASQKLNGTVEWAAAQFVMDDDTIGAVARTTRTQVEEASSQHDATRLFKAAAARAVWPEPGPLARVVMPQATLDDLILPEAQRAEIESLVRLMRHGHTVFDNWGFDRSAASASRGTIALFSGPSGTGKTLAAEAVAAAVGLPLVIADFSQLHSKWVGETSKLAARLFDDIDRGGAILVVNEADGLIGRRVSNLEAQDKHLNGEMGYFLQRLETFRGLAILTTNMRHAIDEAFFRRFRSVIDFPLPGLEERRLLWRKSFPPAAPLEGFDPAEAAALSLSGGAIRNAAITAAFLAVDSGGVIRRQHLAAALRREFQKLERPATELDIGGF